MKIQGSHVFEIERSIVWKALLDPEVLSRTLPGCDQLEADGENRFKGALNTRIGPVQGRFDGSVELTNIDPENGYSLKLDGQGAPGFVNGQGDLKLESVEQGTRLHYDLDIQVGGRIAGLGQRLLDSSAKVLTRQGLEGLEKQLEQAAAAAESSDREAIVETEAQEPEAESQARFAGKFALGVLTDLVPPPVLALIGVAALAGLVMAIRSCS